MGGINQCPVCHEFFYGDERDGYQACRCAREDEVRQLRDLDDRIAAAEAAKADAERELASLLRVRKGYVRRIKGGKP